MGSTSHPKRTTLSRKDIGSVIERIEEAIRGISYKMPRKAKTIEVMRTKKSSIFFFDGEALFVEKGGRIAPSLLNEDAISQIPSVVVDQGAVPFICNGADIMAPGVRRIEGEFSPGQLVVVREERFYKALAVGRAMMKSNEIEKKSRGKVVENAHFVGDDAWQEYS